MLSYDLPKILMPAVYESESDDDEEDGGMNSAAQPYYTSKFPLAYELESSKRQTTESCLITLSLFLLMLKSEIIERNAAQERAKRSVMRDQMH